MTATVERIAHHNALAAAQDLMALLSDCCVRWEICGSIRRGVPMVKDIELVVEPIRQPLQAGLFDVPDGPMRDLVHEKCTELRAASVLEDRLDKNGRPAFGEKYKRLIFEGMSVDLFAVTPPAQWGVIVAIRTGPAEFSHRLVTSKSCGGWMPYGYSVKGGAVQNSGGQVIATPDEESLFAFLERDYIPPEERR